MVELPCEGTRIQTHVARPHLGNPIVSQPTPPATCGLLAEMNFRHSNNTYIGALKDR